MNIILPIFAFLLAIDLLLGYMLLRAAASYIRSDTALKEVNVSLDRQVREHTAQLEYAYRDLESEIAAHKKVEDALRESEERLSVIFHAMSDGVLAADPETTIIRFANNAAVRMLGYSLDELAYMKITQLHPVEDTDINIAKFNDITAANLHIITNVRLKRKDGAIIYVDINPFIINLSGKMYKCGIFRDITSRIHAQQDIMRLNRTYSLVSEINQLIVHVRDKDELLRQLCRIAVDHGKFRMCWAGLIDKQTQLIRPAALSGFGGGYLDSINVSKIDLLSGNNIFSRFNLVNRMFVANDISSDENLRPWQKEALASGYKSCAIYALFLRKTIIGYVSFYSDEINFFSPKEAQLLLELCEDVSFCIEHIDAQLAREQAEKDLQNYKVHLEELVLTRTKDLRAAQDRLEFVLGASNTGLYIVESGYNLVYMSPAWKKIYGDASGRKCFELLKESQAPCANCKVSKALESKKTYMYEESLPKENNRRVQITCVPFQDQAGKWLAAEVCVDITQRKNIEDELNKRLEELELFHKVAVRREIKMVELKIKIDELEGQLIKLRDKNNS